MIRDEKHAISNDGDTPRVKRGKARSFAWVLVLAIGVALIALRSGVPMIPLYIGGKPRLFRRLEVRVGDPIAMDDLRARGVNRDTCEELLARITETYRALTAHPEA